MGRPFLILGSGRSGTTLLYSLLRRHPRIALTNEAKLLDLLVMTETASRIPAGRQHDTLGWCGMVNAEYIPVFSRVFRRHAREVLEDFYRQQFPEKDFTHWGDKMLTLTHPEGLQQLLPDVRVVIQVRDARDTICSIRSHLAKPSVQEAQPLTRDLGFEESVQGWADTYRGLLDTFGDDHHLVRYEDLLRHPERSVAGVLEHLGLPADPELLREAAGADTFTGHGTSPSPAESVGRWRRDLTDEEVRRVEGVCGGLMARFGYELATGGRSGS